MEDLDDIVQEFLVESHENLDTLDGDLVALEQDATSKELLSRIFRTIHTIKGTSGFLAFGRLETLTHAGESLLSRLRDGVKPVTPDTITALLAMVDAVRDPADRDRDQRWRGRRGHRRRARHGQPPASRRGPARLGDAPTADGARSEISEAEHPLLVVAPATPVEVAGPAPVSVELPLTLPISDPVVQSGGGPVQLRRNVAETPSASTWTCSTR